MSVKNSTSFFEPSAGTDGRKKFDEYHDKHLLHEVDDGSSSRGRLAVDRQHNAAENLHSLPSNRQYQVHKNKSNAITRGTTLGRGRGFLI